MSDIHSTDIKVKRINRAAMMLNNVLYRNTYANAVHVSSFLMQETGQEMWSFQCPKPVFSSPVVTSEGVLVGCVNSVLYCLSYTGCQVTVVKTADKAIATTCVTCFFHIFISVG